jgi:glycosyltransferase involved in cell wall biosynthesis
MRVGVLFSHIGPTVGGGFTFQEEVFEAFKAVSGESRHRFVIFRQAPEKESAGRNYEKIETVQVNQNIWDRLLSLFLKSHIGEDLQILTGCRVLNPLAKIARKHEIDLVWFLTPDSFRPLDLPYIAVIWDLQHRLQPWFPEVSAQGRWERRERMYRTMLQRATFVIAANNRGKGEIVQFYQVPPDRIKILPHPTPSFAFKDENQNPAYVLEKFGLSPGYLFYPAQFWPHKNHVILLKALAHLRQETGNSPSLVFTGSDRGNQRYIKQLALDYELGNRVHFLGSVSREEIIGLYRNALALAYPSYFGPENLPPLEAFALGCPVIAARVAGAEEQLGDAALLFEPREHRELALAIKSLLNDPDLRRQLIARGRDRAARWTPQDFVRGIFKILDEFEAVRSCWP